MQSLRIKHGGHHPAERIADGRIKDDFRPSRRRGHCDFAYNAHREQARWAYKCRC